MADIVISDGFFPDGAPVREQYFAALCAESRRLGRMSEAEHTAVLSALAMLLQERILLFTDGESTAVREETAQRILSSILYNSSIALLAAGSHTAALAKLKNEPLTAIHDTGMRITMRTRTRAEVLALLMRLSSGGCDALGLGRQAILHTRDMATWHALNWPETYRGIRWEVAVGVNGPA